MSRTFEYYGNSVFGDGTASPLQTGGEPELYRCYLCLDDMEEDKLEYLSSIKHHVCKSCLQGEPSELLEAIHLNEKISPYSEPEQCLAINRELVSRNLLNFPLFSYIKGISKGVKYNVKLLTLFYKYD